jgi:hypothetical protein
VSGQIPFLSRGARGISEANIDAELD